MSDISRSAEKTHEEKNCPKIYVSVFYSSGKALGIFSTLLVMLCLASQIGKHVLGYPYQMGLVRILALDGEQSIGMWFSTLLFTRNSVLLFLHYVKAKSEQSPWTKHWLFLAALFMFFSLDEAAGVHEMLTYPLRGAYGFTGVFWFAWVVPFGAFILALSIAYLRFLRALPRHTRYRFILSGTVCIAGAIVMEMVGGYFSFTHGEESLLYVFITTVEEGMEMAGLVLFFDTLLRMLGEHVIMCRIHPCASPQPCEGNTPKEYV